MPTAFPSVSRPKAHPAGWPHPAALLLGGAILLVSLIPPASWTALPDLCLFHRATGLLCPTCGMTRCWAALVRGEFASAMRFHALGGMSLVGLLVLLSFRQFTGRWPRVPLVVALPVALLWASYGVGRMIGVWPGF